MFDQGPVQIQERRHFIKKPAGKKLERTASNKLNLK